MKTNDAIINASGIALGNASLIYSFTVISIIFSAMGFSALVWKDWHLKTNRSKISHAKSNRFKSDVDSDDEDSNPIHEEKTTTEYELSVIKKNVIVDSISGNSAKSDQWGNDPSARTTKSNKFPSEIDSDDEDA
jgi:hypothetical protein